MVRPIKSSNNLVRTRNKFRSREEEAFEPKGNVILRAPKWLTPEARVIFNSTQKKMRSLNLLGYADSELLAIYADAVIRYHTLQDPVEKRQWSRVVLSYAEKLGMSPAGRLRMAKKVADAETNEMDEILDGVEEFVNQDAVQ